MSIEETLELVQEFLDLPVTALPHADWVRAEDEELGNPWVLLREFAADPEGCMRWDAPIMLGANRDGWRSTDDVVVTI